MSLPNSLILTATSTPEMIWSMHPLPIVLLSLLLLQFPFIPKSAPETELNSARDDEKVESLESQVSKITL